VTLMCFLNGLLKSINYTHIHLKQLSTAEDNTSEDCCTSTQPRWFYLV